MAIIFKKENYSHGINGLLFELDGYRSHGLSKAGFKSDRENDRLTLLGGFLTFRFYATEILSGKKKGEHLDYLSQIKEQFIK